MRSVSKLSLHLITCIPGFKWLWSTLLEDSLEIYYSYSCVTRSRNSSHDMGDQPLLITIVFLKNSDVATIECLRPSAWQMSRTASIVTPDVTNSQPRCTRSMYCNRTRKAPWTKKRLLKLASFKVPQERPQTFMPDFNDSETTQQMEYLIMHITNLVPGKGKVRPWKRA